MLRSLIVYMFAFLIYVRFTIYLLTKTKEKDVQKNSMVFADLVLAFDLIRF